MYFRSNARNHPIKEGTGIFDPSQSWIGNAIPIMCNDKQWNTSFFPNAQQGFPFHGVEGVFARRCIYVRNRSQPSTTVRAIAIWPMVSSAEGVPLQGFKRRVASFRVAGVALRDIQTSKVVLCGRCNTFATFSEDALQFSWQAQHFRRVHRRFAWQAQHFRRVVLRVFCKSHWQGCVKWRQGANSVAGVAFCAMC